ncbi:hypothetical protein CONLIGDRAFT_583026 [Coniochaeta ligniaria NRRL 30616]|uniref:Uncharacterized protein n=1 Tax=Coniochaeta ligniaria NRRL 30616 TaxID=1408157 RepID=A0A1J7J6P1_9PEZI|nr:hypothetical protein CONLIGDRAFT_583026 [Coniochaeta ligniaria NRRL 30616]
MPIQETITIINNSGKIISTGKHLVNIFKDAKAAYKDKKEALRAERAPAPGIRRAQTFDVVTPRRGGPAVEYYEYDPNDYYEDHVHDRYGSSDRRRSHDDGHSLTSSHRSHRSRASHRHRSASQSRPALTESNLRTHSEVSTTGPSAAPQAYRSPYAETAPRDMALSRPSLQHAATTSAIHPYMSRAAVAPSTFTETASPKSKAIDLNLAYGNIPPDLASRVDLDVYDDDHGGPPPAFVSSAVCQNEEQEARTLMARIEAFLDEAHCIQHSATAIIAHLQDNPEAAAAVALTLAELSALLGKLSPAFLTVVKGGSPAIFALLASPQFLIAAGVAVGVTVVMFGGWKIVKRIREAKKEKENAVAFEAQQQGPPGQAPYEPFIPAAYGGAGSGFDEALVLEEELSTIESWRRGIVPFGEDESADMELISPEAERRRREDKGDGIAPDDSASRSGRTEKSSRSHRTNKTSQRSGHGHHRSSRRHGDGNQDDIPERKSSKGFKTREGGDNESERSSSHRSHKSSRSKKTEKAAPKAIEGGSKETGNTLDVVLHKEKKPNMLKTLFKKKKEREDNDRAGVSVLA